MLGKTFSALALPEKKPGIVDDGFRRLRMGQKELSMVSIQKEYANELTAAPAAGKPKIYARMTRELLRQKNHKPSAATLW